MPWQLRLRSRLHALVLLLLLPLLPDPPWPLLRPCQASPAWHPIAATQPHGAAAAAAAATAVATRSAVAAAACTTSAAANAPRFSCRSQGYRRRTLNATTVSTRAHAGSKGPLRHCRRTRTPHLGSGTTCCLPGRCSGSRQARQRRSRRSSSSGTGHVGSSSSSRRSSSSSDPRHLWQQSTRRLPDPLPLSLLLLLPHTTLQRLIAGPHLPLARPQHHGRTPRGPDLDPTPSPPALRPLLHCCCRSWSRLALASHSATRACTGAPRVRLGPPPGHVQAPHSARQLQQEQQTPWQQQQPPSEARSGGPRSTCQRPRPQRREAVG